MSFVVIDLIEGFCECFIVKGFCNC